jgi:hypothetical protein
MLQLFPLLLLIRIGTMPLLLMPVLLGRLRSVVLHVIGNNEAIPFIVRIDPRFVLTLLVGV